MFEQGRTKKRIWLTCDYHNFNLTYEIHCSKEDNVFQFEGREAIATDAAAQERCAADAAGSH